MIVSKWKQGSGPIGDGEHFFFVLPKKADEALESWSIADDGVKALSRLSRLFQGLKGLI